jgi:chemotaxis protein methyltransferase CheR
VAPADASGPMDRELRRDEFQRYRDLVYRLAGIHYPPEKLELLSSRVRRRLRASGAASHGEYLARLHDPRQGAELDAFLDAVTTHETYFFRCPRHWAWFRDRVAQHLAGTMRRAPLRVWSAAAANGAEPYTIAIVLHDAAATADVLATDLSAPVLADARRAVYRGHALARTPADVVARHFTRTAEDQFAFDRDLARRVQFERHNLMEPLPASFGTFDVVFLRNVMIYFDDASRERALAHVHDRLRAGGHLVLGEAESLLGVAHPFQYVQPSIFVKPAASPAPVAARGGR